MKGEKEGWPEYLRLRRETERAPGEEAKVEVVVEVKEEAEGGGREQSGGGEPREGSLSESKGLRATGNSGCSARSRVNGGCKRLTPAERRATPR